MIREIAEAYQGPVLEADLPARKHYHVDRIFVWHVVPRRICLSCNIDIITDPGMLLMISSYLFSI